MQESLSTLIEVANQYPKEWLILYAVDMVVQNKEGHLDYEEVGQIIYEGGKVPLKDSKFPIKDVHFGRLVTEFPPLLVSGEVAEHG